MIKPTGSVRFTSNFNHNKINFKNNAQITKPVSPVEVTSTSSNDSLADFVQYLKDKDAKEKKQGLIATLFSLGTVISVVALTPLLIKKINSNTTKGIRNVSAFTSLKNDVSIPTLETCKSINQKLKTFLQQQVDFANATPEDLKKTGISKTTNRLLMYGEPGSGKSYFAKIFAKTIDADYLEIKYSDLNKQYCGEHIENVKNIFDDIIKTAKKSPKKKFVVNFNEIDALAQSAQRLQEAGGSHHSFKLEERSVFLTYMEELAEKTPNVILIGSTNISPDAGRLDGAVMSRFQNIINVSRPDLNCMFEALKANIEVLPEGKEFIKNNEDKLKEFSKTLVDRKASYRDLNNVIESSKTFYLRDTIKDKRHSYKLAYLEQARDAIEATDGELYNTTVKNA